MSVCSLSSIHQHEVFCVCIWTMAHGLGPICAGMQLLIAQVARLTISLMFC